MKKIIIVGAGISGLYLANFLEINGKYDYKILEKRSSLDLNDGYGVQLSVNAIKLLNKVGFKNLAVHDVYYPSNINFYKANNCKLISKINISQFNQQGNFYTTLKRSVLINFLLKNIPRDIYNSLNPVDQANLLIPEKNVKDIPRDIFDPKYPPKTNANAIITAYSNFTRPSL